MLFKQILPLISEIESQIRDIQEKKKQQAAEEERAKGIGFDSSGFYDSEFYDGGQGKGKYEGYVTSIAANEDEDDDDDEPLKPAEKQRTTGFGAPIALINDVSRVNLYEIPKSSKKLNIPFPPQNEPDFDPFENRRVKTVGEKEDEYRQKRRNQILSPDRIDPFADGKFR